MNIHMQMRKAIFVQAVTVLLLALGPATHGDCPPGDLNRDCRVDVADLRILAEQWLTESETPADLDRTGRVDGRDLARFAEQWQQVSCPIVINEVLAHAHAEASDWIELYNVSSVPVDIGGWFLSDTETELLRYRIPAGTIVDPCGYVVLYETTHFANPFDPGVQVPFAFSENGEAAYLFSADDPVFPNCLVAVPFGASETSNSFGRHRRSTGTYDFLTMREATPGRANAYPLVGPVVINEIMYHPPTDGDAEYVELLNISSGPITLFDVAAMEPWRLTDDSGVSLWFPADEPLTLEAGEHLLLARDERALASYPVPAGAKVLYWGSGKLANQGENLVLFKPGDVDQKGTRYWIEVDRVRYSDGAHPEEFPDGIDPWPVEADGGGLSLNRLFPSRYGNDPNNWHATIPTPGSVND